MTQLLARISVQKPWVTVGVWIVLVVIGAALTQRLLDSATTTEFRLSGSAESERAAKLLKDRLRGPEPVTEIIIVQSESLTVDAPEFRQKVESVYGEIVSLGEGVVAFAQNYYQANDESLVSADRKTTIMLMVMIGSLEEAGQNIGTVLEVVEELDSSDDFRVLIGGASSIDHELNKLSTHDLEQGERFGVPVALLILLALFGTVVAALLPIGLAVVAIIVALSLAAVIGQVFELVFFVTLMITMIGLAVGIDYSLFIISRYREETQRGLNSLQAIERTGETAGRTVLFSGVTVVIALCGLLIVPFPFLQSLGLGAILVVIVALAATLTLLPAVLALLGPKLNRLRIPYFGRSAVENPEPSNRGFWEVVTQNVTKFPVISIVAIGVPMIAVTLFYFDIRTGINGVDTYPEGAETREHFFVLNEEFSFGLVNPIEIVIDGNINDPQVKSAIEKLETSLRGSPSFPLPPQLVVNAEGNLALMTVVIPGEPRNQAAMDVVTALRDQHIPSARGNCNCNGNRNETEHTD